MIRAIVQLKEVVLKKSYARDCEKYELLNMIYFATPKTLFMESGNKRRWSTFEVDFSLEDMGSTTPKFSNAM